LNELKSGLKNQPNIFQYVSKLNQTVVKESYVMSHPITSNSKPFTDG